MGHGLGCTPLGAWVESWLVVLVIRLTADQGLSYSCSSTLLLGNSCREAGRAASIKVAVRS